MHQDIFHAIFIKSKNNPLVETLQPRWNFFTKEFFLFFHRAKRSSEGKSFLKQKKGKKYYGIEKNWLLNNEKKMKICGFTETRVLLKSLQFSKRFWDFPAKCFHNERLQKECIHCESLLNFVELFELLEKLTNKMFCYNLVNWNF